MTELETLAKAMADAHNVCPYQSGGANHSEECRKATIAYALKNKEVQDAKKEAGNDLSRTREAV